MFNLRDLFWLTLVVALVLTLYLQQLRSSQNLTAVMKLLDIQDRRVKSLEESKAVLIEALDRSRREQSEAARIRSWEQR